MEIRTEQKVKSKGNRMERQKIQKQKRKQSVGKKWNGNMERKNMGYHTTDGYSTESPEHLHINFSKSAFCASNKKNYVKQMTKWLQCQESIKWFATYLQWAVPRYICQFGSGESNKDKGSDKEKQKSHLNTITLIQLPNIQNIHMSQSQILSMTLVQHHFLRLFNISPRIPHTPVTQHPHQC